VATLASLQTLNIYIMNFIRIHLVSQILKNYVENCRKFSHDGFFYFNDKVGKINRVGKGFLYNEEEVLHLDWRKVKDKELLTILKKIKNKDFFFYKSIDGKFYKTRPKQNVKT
jgi:hypothetical protein